jgi:hypothetical protein
MTNKKEGDKLISTREKKTKKKKKGHREHNEALFLTHSVLLEKILTR